MISTKIVQERYYTFPDKETMKREITPLKHFSNQSSLQKVALTHPVVAFDKYKTLEKVIPVSIDQLAGKECSDSHLDEIINGIVARTCKYVVKTKLQHTEETIPLINTWLRTPLKTLLQEVAHTTFQHEMKTLKISSA